MQGRKLTGLFFVGEGVKNSKFPTRRHNKHLITKAEKYSIVILLIYKCRIGAIDGRLGQIKQLPKVLVSCIRATLFGGVKNSKFPTDKGQLFFV